jgi:hypothetical protein
MEFFIEMQQIKFPTVYFQNKSGTPEIKGIKVIFTG